MRDLLNILLFAADDGGAGGGAGDGGDGGAGDAAAAAAAGAGDAGKGGGGAGDGGDPAAFYRPEGLPDSMVGKDERETMDKMAKALNGYRDRDAKVKVPEDAGEYFKFGDDQPEEIRPYLAEIAEDEAMSKPMADFLKAEKIPVETFQKIAGKFLGISAEMGLMEPPVDVAAEREALLPEAAKHLPEAERKKAIDARMNENFSYVDGLVEKAGLDKDAAEYAKAMLGDSAKGHQFFEFMQKAMGRNGGGGPAMGDLANGGDKSARAALQAEMAKPEMQRDHPKFDRKAYEALMQRYQQEIGN
ncbi:MAG: hypothetical protein CMH13_11220 [Martelella sp.]|uniref:hypothetical protein n=1 Tax=Martelella sp. TaxID=1969699 RepID=UPI000C5D2BE4|nr:hypothetical protein [Martelella sp.]MAU21090.1 hypothetical protein [Martelella sp.]